MDLHTISITSPSNYTRALQILGLNDPDKQKNSTGIRDIEQAYRRLARIHHPDRNGGDEKSFLLLTAAKDFLVSGGADDDNNNNKNNNNMHGRIFRHKSKYLPVIVCTPKIQDYIR